jgi:hypothetical protein
MVEGVPNNTTMKNKIKSAVSEKKKNVKKCFKSKRSVDKRVYLFVIVVYAIFGLESVAKTIYDGSSAYLENRFSKTVIVNEAVAKDPTVSKIETVKENVTCNDWAEEFGGANTDLIKRIIKAESGNNELAKNPTSTASGCSQWLWGSWHNYGTEYWGDEFFEKSVWSPKDNVQLTAYVIDKYGSSPWNASKHNWK